MTVRHTGLPGRFLSVMPALVAGIHVLIYSRKGVDGRDADFGARSRHYKLLAISSFMSGCFQ